MNKGFDDGVLESTNGGAEASESNKPIVDESEQRSMSRLNSSPSDASWQSSLTSQHEETKLEKENQRLSLDRERNRSSASLRSDATASTDLSRDNSRGRAAAQDDDGDASGEDMEIEEEEEKEEEEEEEEAADDGDWTPKGRKNGRSSKRRRARRHFGRSKYEFCSLNTVVSIIIINGDTVHLVERQINWRNL